MAVLLLVGGAGCASGTSPSLGTPPDAAIDARVDAMVADAALPPDASDPPDAPVVDAAAVDAPPVDAPGPVMVTVSFDAPECTPVTCPPEAPFPVGCSNIMMTGTSSLGCVANAPGSSVVEFEQANLCQSDTVSGNVLCSSVAGPPLDATNCPLPRSTALYLTDLANCR